jgi:hypothetical protein
MFSPTVHWLAGKRADACFFSQKAHGIPPVWRAASFSSFLWGETHETNLALLSRCGAGSCGKIDERSIACIQELLKISKHPGV